MTTVDRLVADDAPLPTVLKIDVEGAELLVLRGATALLASTSSPRLIFLEVHPQFLPSLGICGRSRSSDLGTRLQACKQTPWRSGPFDRDSGLIRRHHLPRSQNEALTRKRSMKVWSLLAPLRSVLRRGLNSFRSSFATSPDRFLLVAREPAGDKVARYDNDWISSRRTTRLAST